MDDDVIKLDAEVTSMRPEQDGSDHDHPEQVAPLAATPAVMRSQNISRS